MIYFIQGGLLGVYLLAMGAFFIIIVILAASDIINLVRGRTPARQLWGEGRQR